MHKFKKPSILYPTYDYNFGYVPHINQKIIPFVTTGNSKIVKQFSWNFLNKKDIYEMYDCG